MLLHHCLCIPHPLHHVCFQRRIAVDYSSYHCGGRGQAHLLLTVCLIIGMQYWLQHWLLSWCDERQNIFLQVPDRCWGLDVSSQMRALRTPIFVLIAA
jgi:hypothetical protein